MRLTAEHLSSQNRANFDGVSEGCVIRLSCVLERLGAL
jgi:hypothetical protein